MYKNWAYFLSWTCSLLRVYDGKEVSLFLRLDYDRKNTKYAETLMIGCVKPKWGWSMAFSRVMCMKNTLTISHLTCQVLTLVVKKKYKKWRRKKSLHECKQVLHINLIIIIIHLWEREKKGRLKRKSSRHLEVAATSININTLLLNQRKRAWWHKNLHITLFLGRMIDFRLTAV